MATRWNDWYWKGAGAFGAGRVPIGYVTAWSVNMDHDGEAWIEVDYMSWSYWNPVYDWVDSIWVDL